MGNYFDDSMGIIFVQPNGPNTKCEPLFCHDVDSVDAPAGDVTTSLCLTATREWETIHTSQGAPSRASFSIETWVAKTRGWLQKQVERRCPLPMYLQWADCGDKDIFLNYQTGRSLRNVVLTSGGNLSSSVKQRGEEGQAATQTGLAFDGSAEPLPPFYWKLVLTLRAIAEAEPLRDIAFCNNTRCLGACGPTRDKCLDGIIAPDATGPGAADVWFTDDGWATGAAVVGPFPAVKDVASAVCFPIDATTTRHLVAIGTTTAVTALNVAYSDDGGTTWTLVTVGPANGDYAVHGGALFALDAHHIWLCTQLGFVYFSDDGGVTWTDQAAPQPTPAEALYCVRFRDANYGMCVGGTTGASSVLLTTTDGGAHWYLGTGPVNAILTGVTVIDSNRAWVCTEGGETWYTNDFGVTWAERVLPEPAAKLGDIVFIDEYAGAACGYKTVGADEFAIVYRTYNGGYDWEHYVHAVAFDTTPSYFGLNALWMCDLNHIFAVGEPADLVGLIIELSPLGSV